MPRQKNEFLVPRTLKLVPDDLKKLQEYYPKLGYSAVIRTLVRRHVKMLDESTNRKLDPASTVNVDLPETPL